MQFNSSCYTVNPPVAEFAACGVDLKSPPTILWNICFWKSYFCYKYNNNKYACYKTWTVPQPHVPTCRYVFAIPESMVAVLSDCPILHLQPLQIMLGSYYAPIKPSHYLRYPSRFDPLRLSPMMTRTNHLSLKENSAVKKNRTWWIQHINTFTLANLRACDHTQNAGAATRPAQKM